MPRRQDRQGALEARVRLPVPRSATPPGRAARRPSTTARSTPSARWATCSASTPTTGTVRLVEELPEGLRGEDADLGLLPATRSSTRTCSICLVGGEDSVAGRVRQGHRQGDVEGAHRRRDAGLLPADAHRRPAATKQLVDLARRERSTASTRTPARCTGTCRSKPAYGMSIMAPRQSGDQLFAGGIGGAGVVLKLDQGQAGRHGGVAGGTAGGTKAEAAASTRST